MYIIVFSFYLLPLGILEIIICPLQVLKINKQETGDSYKNIISKIKQYGSFILFQCYTYSIIRSFSNFYILIFFIGFIGYNEIIDNSLFSRIFIGYFIVLIFGFLQTLLTFIPETKQIIKSKISGVNNHLNLRLIFFLMLIRNLIILFGVYFFLFFFTFLSRINLHIYSELFILLIPILFILASVPFDVMVTQMCSSDKKINITQKIKELKLSCFRGGSIFLIQNIILYIPILVLLMSSKNV
jgi:hypothetical protein